MKADLTPDVDSAGNLDIILRAPSWQVVVRCLSCLRCIGCVLLKDDNVKMLRIQRFPARPWILAYASVSGAECHTFFLRESGLQVCLFRQWTHVRKSVR